MFYEIITGTSSSWIDASARPSLLFLSTDRNSSDPTQSASSESYSNNPRHSKEEITTAYPSHLLASSSELHASWKLKIPEVFRIDNYWPILLTFFKLLL